MLAWIGRWRQHGHRGIPERRHVRPVAMRTARFHGHFGPAVSVVALAVFGTAWRRGSRNLTRIPLRPPRLAFRASGRRLDFSARPRPRRVELDTGLVVGFLARAICATGPKSSRSDVSAALPTREAPRWVGLLCWGPGRDGQPIPGASASALRPTLSDARELTLALCSEKFVQSWMRPDSLKSWSLSPGCRAVHTTRQEFVFVVTKLCCRVGSARRPARKPPRLRGSSSTYTMA
jgi:hypothetical protein